jgi:hypothetical protein
MHVSLCILYQCCGTGAVKRCDPTALNFIFDCVYNIAESIFVVKYLCEYESIFETALAHESVDPGVLFDEQKKKSRSKISWDCPFK